MRVVCKSSHQGAILFTTVILGALATKANTLFPISNSLFHTAPYEFFIPLPEAQLFENTFQKINSAASGDITSLISISISANNTIVYWDHWEDGYEPDINDADETPSSLQLQPRTEVWGDGDASNGCAPSALGRSPLACTDASDVLLAGRSIVIDNAISIMIHHINNNDHDDDDDIAVVLKYDGGDRIKSSHPIAITRGAYPAAPGSLMAGAVEVFSKEYGWGTEFVSPVGVNLNESNEYTAMYCMAADNDTVVMLNHQKVFFLNQGQSIVYTDLQQGDILTANQKVQVHLLTGDTNSIYEQRWFALLPREYWSNSYVSPIGNTKAQVVNLIYNPSRSKSIRVDWRWKQDFETDNTMAMASNGTTLEPGASVITNVIPTNSGAFMDSNDKFIALTIVDTFNNGQVYDWGLAVVPTERLTPQVLVGLGFGCTANQCEEDGNGSSRSVIWITPVEDADLYIDFDNDGVFDKVLAVIKMKSYRVTSPNKDMSGAFLWATRPGEGENGVPVNIAAAWGQDPEASGEYDAFALDLGTIVAPLPTLSVSASIWLESGSGRLARIGDTVECTIRIMNSGAAGIPVGSLSVFVYGLEGQAEYVPLSSSYEVVRSERHFNISDSLSGSSFPFIDGVFNLRVLKGRGAEHALSFLATIDPADDLLSLTEFTMSGILQGSTGILPFRASLQVDASSHESDEQPSEPPSVSPTQQFITQAPSSEADQMVDAKIAEPQLWEITLVGNNCPDKVWTMMEFIQKMLLEAFHKRIPDAAFVSPGETSDLARTEASGRRTLRGHAGSTDRELVKVNMCPKQCTRPQYVQWCYMMGCACRNCGFRRQLQWHDREHRAVSIVEDPALDNESIIWSNLTWDGDFNVSDTHWSWLSARLNTWTDYSQREEEFEKFTSRTRSEAPFNYIAVVKDMSYVLTRLATSLNEWDPDDSVLDCFLGAELNDASISAP